MISAICVAGWGRADTKQSIKKHIPQTRSFLILFVRRKIMKNERMDKTVLPDRWSYLWLGLAAILLVFTYGMYRNALAALFAPVFLLRFFRSQKTGRGYLLVVAALVFSNVISWWNTSNDSTILVRIIFGVVVGVLYSIPFLLDRVLVRKFHGFVSTLIFPVTFAAYEFLTFWPSPMSTYGSIAYSQFSSPTLTQLISITGLWGISFIVAWFASMVNWIWEENFAWLSIRKGLAIYVGVMLMVVIFGTVRLSAFLPEKGTVRIHGIIETDYTYDDSNKEFSRLIGLGPAAVKGFTEPIYNRYLEATIREAQAGAKIVVWPEVAVFGYREDLDALLKKAGNIAKKQDIYLVLGYGLLTTDPNAYYVDENRFAIIDPQGEKVVDTLKYGCTFAFGMYAFQLPVVDTPYGRLAGVPCCDLDFPYVIRQASQKGVDILFVPSFEPSMENQRAHSLMAPFRAIENGFSIFRLTIQGFSQAFDPYGRTIGYLNDTLSNEKVLVMQMPNHHITTIYSLVGDLFGWLMVIGFVVIVVIAIVRRRRNYDPQPKQTDHAA
jgi:apolipoprotein N-acyltransferase